MDEYKYEVAISCLKEDELLAQELYDLLQPRVKSLFFYTQNQKDLIGEEGVAAFGDVYRRESRVVVVVYRDGWGKTKWTGVEDRAIRELYLNRGWSRIVVYSANDTTPSWLPESFVWAGKRYGLTALAGAIEQKVKEAGGEVGEEDVLAKAQRVGRSLAAAEAREARRDSEEAVRAAYKERRAIDARLAERASSLDSSPGLLQGQEVSGMYTVLTSEVALAFWWDGNTVNSIRGDKLTLIFSTGALGYKWRDEAAREVAKYELELAEDDATWRWVEAGKGRRYTSVELADYALQQLIDEHERRVKAALGRRRRS